MSSNRLQLVRVISFIFTVTILTTTIPTPTPGAVSVLPPLTTPPPSSSPLQDQSHSSSSLFAPILAKLGFRELAAASAVYDSLSTTTASTSAVPSWRGPATIFAPTDSSLLTCPSCYLPLLLQEHTVPGLYSFHYLRMLAFGTKIETLASSRCLTITSTRNSDKLFVGGVEITRPDLYNDGDVAVHGIQGFISHLSPISCIVERTTSLSFPPSPAMTGLFLMRLMLDDAMLRLRISGFSVTALALKVKYSELLDLRSLTVFAIDDASIFSGGQSFVSNLSLHILPNRRFMASDLESLPAATVLPTMEWGQNLVVTTAGGGGPLLPMRINYVKVTSPDFLYNLKIAVHGLPLPFNDINRTVAVDLAEISRCRFKSVGFELERNAGTCKEAPMPVNGKTVEAVGHRGL